MKTLLTLTGALLLAAPVLHAQQHRFYGGGYNGGGRPTIDRGRYGAYHGGYGYGRHGGGRGRYYYIGGIPYFYPYFGLGFGYPYYGGWYGDGFGYGGGYGYGPDGANGDGTYEGRIADRDNDDKNNGDRPPSSGRGPSLPTAVQRQLAKKGYYKGTIDGQFGPASRSALSRFQHDNDLRETGRIDEDTLDKLGFTDHP